MIPQKNTKCINKKQIMNNGSHFKVGFFINLNTIKVINVFHLAPYLCFTLYRVVFTHAKLQLYKKYGYIYILKD